MDLTRYLVSASTTIAAPAEAVWATISDITRMGEFSPVCKKAEWDDRVTAAAPGAWFTGHNTDPQRSWSTRCLVEEAEPGRVFSFVNHGSTGDTPIVRWRYELTPTDGGTEVTETREVLPGYPEYLQRRAPGLDVAALLDDGLEGTVESIKVTLAALKEACER